MEESKGTNFIIRTLSGIVLLAVVTGAVLLSPWSFGLLLMIICGFSLWEFYTMAEQKGLHPQKTAGTVIGTLTAGIWLGYFADAPVTATMAIIFIAILCPFILIAAELYRNKQDAAANLGATFLGIIYIAIPLFFFGLLYILVHETSPAMGQGPWAILWYIFIIWMNDIGAYLFGITLGKHRLFERISPKKSWEGFFGGLLFGIGTGVAAAAIMGWDILFWAGLGLVAVVSGVFGDLVESMFKRSVGVKDSGKIIPGHGGMLDRFDALIFSVPFVFVYFFIFAL